MIPDAVRATHAAHCGNAPSPDRTDRTGRGRTRCRNRRRNPRTRAVRALDPVWAGWMKSSDCPVSRHAAGAPARTHIGRAVLKPDGLPDSRKRAPRPPSTKHAVSVSQFDVSPSTHVTERPFEPPSIVEPSAQSAIGASRRDGTVSATGPFVGRLTPGTRNVNIPARATRRARHIHERACLRTRARTHS